MADSRTFYIALDDCTHYYYPGQTVTGNVVRVMEEPGEEIEYINLTIQGMATASWITEDEESSFNFTTHSNEEIFFDVTVPLNQKHEDSSRTSLMPGRNEFPFTFELPEDIPSSYKDTDVKAPCRIFYQAQGSYRAKGDRRRKILDFLNIPVLRPWDVKLNGYVPLPKVLEGKTQRGFLCCKSLISFKLTFTKILFVMGENIDVFVELVNDSRKNVSQVELWISRTVYFVGSDKEVQFEIYREPLGERISLPGLLPRQHVEKPVSLEIPTHEQINAFGCSFMESIYQFHIEMVIPGAEDLTGILPLLIVEAFHE